MKRTVLFRDLGLMEYQKALDLQEEIFENSIREKKSITDINTDNRHFNLLFCEHPHVYTLGKSGQEENLLINNLELQSKKAQFIKTNRGGDITYHGPAQLVGYPILDLEAFHLGVRSYIELMEESIIETIAEYGLKGELMEGATGVWMEAKSKINARKICAIGVRTSHFISMHGFALNVNTDLSYFNYINPCGFTDKGVTSMAKELGYELNMEEVKEVLLEKMTKLFNWKIKNYYNE